MTRKLSGTSKQSGLTLIELLISVALTLSLSIALIQLHTQSKLIADRQQSVSRQLENAATLSHIVGHSLRDALETVSFSAGSVEGSDEVVLSAFNQRCVGISSGGQCLAPVLSWNMDDVGAPDISGVSSGSSVLQVKQNCCPDVIADQFYLARRGNNQSNPLSLYRRRMKTDGSYTAAAEMVE
ncbi:MAG: prepilin-type N-terminal cleavage/methylation domain-containing protein, partial [Gammaproteobacteria bacterium]|nr:prepilin-type N-terminal cleavage/methylation domain-containing protein [Gammaproteobacteria bacterium]